MSFLRQCVTCNADWKKTCAGSKHFEVADKNVNTVLVPSLFRHSLTAQAMLPNVPPCCSRRTVL